MARNQKETRPCPRCGRVRIVNVGRYPNSTGLCRDCNDTDPGWPDTVRTPR